MAERRRDGFSLVVGLLAVLTGGLFLLDRGNVLDVDGGVTVAALVLLVGALAVVRSLLGLRRQAEGSETTL